MKKGLALITGGSSGIGYEYARQLAEKGYDLLLVSYKEDELESASASLTQDFEVKVLTHYADLAIPGAADSLFEWCKAEGLEVEILINNAGIFFFGELTAERYNKAKAMVGLHVETPTRLCILFGNEMKKRGHGTIINMSSLAAGTPVPGITLYCATKSYLKTFGKAFYYELKPYGVSITTVCPGGIATPLYGLRDDLMELALKLRVIRTRAWLVRKVLRAAEHKRRLVRPGLMNSLLIPIVDWFPSSLETKLWVKYRK